MLQGLVVHWVLPMLASLEHSWQVFVTLTPWAVGMALLAQLFSYIASGYMMQALLGLTSQQIRLWRSTLIFLGAASIGLVAGGTNLWGDLWTVEADRSQLDHVLLNLCVNARDAMPAGGMLLLETEKREVGEDAKQQILLTPGKYVVVKVSDTGMGMDEEVRKHIFEPFFTTKEKGKGTGMGLAMAYGVIRNHEGHIEVESEPLGRGTTFAIYLPAAEEKVQEPETGQHVVPSGKGTILLVDDEEFVRSFARDILEKLGYKVIEACDGREALDKYRDGNGAIDLVLLDLIMPRMSGEQTYQRLKEINPEVKVLIASGYGIGETGDTVKYAGIAGFIQKPFKVSDIAQAVDRTLSSA